MTRLSLLVAGFALALAGSAAADDGLEPLDDAPANANPTPAAATVTTTTSTDAALAPMDEGAAATSTSVYGPGGASADEQAHDRVADSSRMARRMAPSLTRRGLCLAIRQCFLAALRAVGPGDVRRPL